MTITHHLDEATRLLDPAIIILDEFTQVLESEATNAYKHPEYAQHFAQRVFNSFIPVFNSVCSSIFKSRDEVLAANESFWNARKEEARANVTVSQRTVQQYVRDSTLTKAEQDRRLDDVVALMQIHGIRCLPDMDEKQQAAFAVGLRELVSATVEPYDPHTLPGNDR